MSLGFYRRGVVYHRCLAPYFEKQQPRFPKGDLVSNPPSLAGVWTAQLECALARASTLPLLRQDRVYMRDFAQKREAVCTIVTRRFASAPGSCVC